MNPLDLITYPGDFAALPKPEVPYYIASQEGPYIYKRTMLGTVLAPVKTIDGLPAMDPEHKKGSFWWNAPKIPARLMGQATRWFAHIWETQKTEAALLITYNPDDPRLYRLFVPPQEAGGASVTFAYDATAIQKGWSVVGSIHSHCDFGSHHSGTDTRDATEIPGIHITIGHVNTKPDYDVFVGLHDIEFAFDYASVCEPPDMEADPPAWWDAYVIKKTYTAAKKGSVWTPTKGSHASTIWDDYMDYDSMPSFTPWQQRTITKITAPPKPKQTATIEDILTAYDSDASDRDLSISDPIAMLIRREMRVIMNVEKRLQELGVMLDWTLDEEVNI